MPLLYLLLSKGGVWHILRLTYAHSPDLEPAHSPNSKNNKETQTRHNGRERDRDRDKDKHRDRDSGRDRGRDRDRDRERGRDWDRHGGRDRGRDRDREKDRDWGRDREKDRDRDRGRDRDSSKDHDQDKDREKETERERDRERGDKEKNHEQSGRDGENERISREKDVSRGRSDSNPHRTHITATSTTLQPPSHKDNRDSMSSQLAQSDYPVPLRRKSPDLPSSSGSKGGEHQHQHHPTAITDTRGLLSASARPSTQIVHRSTPQGDASNGDDIGHRHGHSSNHRRHSFDGKHDLASPRSTSTEASEQRAGDDVEHDEESDREGEQELANAADLVNQIILKCRSISQLTVFVAEMLKQNIVPEEATVKIVDLGKTTAMICEQIFQVIRGSRNTTNPLETSHHEGEEEERS